MMKKYNYRNERETQMWLDFEEMTDERFHQIGAGDSYIFDDVCILVLRVYNPEITDNFCNNSSAVFRIDGPKKRVLILGDMGVEAGEEVMQTVPAEELQADYTQLAHHGQNGVNFAFYEYIQPKACLWASPDWLWDNDAGDGFDTGPFATVRTREWMERLGVTEHIIEKDGTTRIEI